MLFTRLYSTIVSKSSEASSNYLFSDPKCDNFFPNSQSLNVNMFIGYRFYSEEKKNFPNMTHILQRSGNEEFMPVIAMNLKGTIAKPNYMKSLALKNALILPLHSRNMKLLSFYPFITSFFNYPLISSSHH